jgi:hypothetical protein
MTYLSIADRRSQCISILTGWLLTLGTIRFVGFCSFLGLASELVGCCLLSAAAAAAAPAVTVTAAFAQAIRCLRIHLLCSVLTTMQMSFMKRLQKSSG